jgi:hypothetical protein
MFADGVLKAVNIASFTALDRVHDLPSHLAGRAGGNPLPVVHASGPTAYC